MHCRLLRVLMMASVLSSGVACREKTPAVTAVSIEATFSGTFAQLQFTLLDHDGKFLFDPLVRPEKATTLASPQSLVVYLDDALVDTAGVVRCQVEGRQAGGDWQLIGSGESTLKRHQKVSCVVSDGTATVPPDGGIPGAEAGSIVDGKRAGDLAVPERDGPPSTEKDASARDGALTDASLTPPADGAVVVTPDAPVANKDTAVPGVDAPAGKDAATVPPDAPVTPDAGVDVPSSPPSGCADGDREGFLDRLTFPNVAACGSNNAAVTFDQAVGLAGSVCAAGWHWCDQAEIGALTATAMPGTTPGVACSWLGTQGGQCSDKLDTHNQPNCQGSTARSASISGAPSGAACTGLLGCTEPWRLVVPLDTDWSTVSTLGSACNNHVALQCAATVGGAKCWITCCR